MEHISSRENEKVKMACKISASAGARQETGLFFAEGKRLCFDLAMIQKPKMAFVSKEFLKGCPQAEDMADETYLISDPVADKLSGTKNSQGLYCLFSLPETSMDNLDFTRGILLCENLQNPENVGAIVRSAAAFGYGGVILLNCADIYSPKALRASMGGVSRIKISTASSLEEVLELFTQKGTTLYATALEEANSLTETVVKNPFALAIGNEGAGLSDQLLAAAEKKIFIPMQNGMESLNAAVAASLFMFYCKENN